MKILLALGAGPVAASLAFALQGLSWSVVEDRRGDDAVQLVEAGGIDAALVDGDASGAKALVTDLRSAKPDLALMAIGREPSLALKERLFGAGADDVLSHPVPPAEILIRARAIARRRHGHGRDVLRFGALAVLPGSHAEVDGRLLALTPSEFVVLERLALRAGRVLDRAALLSALPRDRDEPGEKVIDKHVCTLRKALAAAGLPAGTVETVWGRGWRLPAPVVTAAPSRPWSLAPGLAR